MKFGIQLLIDIFIDSGREERLIVIFMLLITRLDLGKLKISKYENVILVDKVCKAVTMKR